MTAQLNKVATISNLHKLWIVRVVFTTFVGYAIWAYVKDGEEVFLALEKRPLVFRSRRALLEFLEHGASSNMSLIQNVRTEAHFKPNFREFGREAAECSWSSITRLDGRFVARWISSGAQTVERRDYVRMLDSVNLLLDMLLSSGEDALMAHYRESGAIWRLTSRLTFGEPIEWTPREREAFRKAAGDVLAACERQILLVAAKGISRHEGDQC